MTNPRHIEIVNRLNAASMTKDYDVIKELIHPDYTLRDPQMNLSGRDAFIDFMKECPADGSVKQLSVMAEGNVVVQVLECSMATPVPFSFRMCDIVTIENGKVVAEETFYDTADIPKEALQRSPGSTASKKKVA